MDKAPSTELSPQGQEIPEPPRTRRRRRRLVGLAVIAALAMPGLVSLALRPASPSRVGDESGPAAPPFELDNLRPDEPDVILANYRGQPVVVNFFASWCVPCRREMPALERVHRQFEGQVAFVGVDHQDQRDAALRLLRESGVGYPAGFDPGGKVAQAYGLFGMPTTVFISSEGHIVDRHTGELNESKLSELIRQHLLPPAGSAARP